MTRQPDSLLTAAKKVAEIINIKWAEVHRFYRALQEGPEPGLPRSLGRLIYFAQAQYIAHLLTALAAASDPSEANAAVTWTQKLTPGGRKMDLSEEPSQFPSPFDHEFSRYLSDPAAADGLVNIEFQPDTLCVIFNRRSGRSKIFKRPYNDSTPTPKIAIQKRGVIAGSVIQQLSRSINWHTRRPGTADFKRMPTADKEA